MEPLVEAPAPDPEPPTGRTKAIPTPLLFLLGGLAGLSLGLPFGLDTSKMPALTGLILIVFALLLGSRARVPARAGIAIAAIFGAVLGLIGGYVWRGRQEATTYRDTSRDHLFETKGQIRRATLSPVSSNEEQSADGSESTQYCASVSWHLDRDGTSYQVNAKRCDLSKSLWKFLEKRAYGGVDIVYLPLDLDDLALSPGTNYFHDFDYRFAKELSSSAVGWLRAHCETPDPACSAQ